MSEEQNMPDVQPESSRLPALQHVTRQHLQALRQDEHALTHAYELFTNRERVWPDQCKNIAGLVQKVQKPVQELFTLLECQDLRSMSIGSHRYVMLMTLQHIDEQITVLPPLIMKFRSTCQMQPRQASKQKEEIQQRLKTLLLAYVRTVQDVGVLSDILRFQTNSALPISQSLEDAPEQQ